MEEFKRKVLFNKLEYVELFRLNRPIQTTEESVLAFKTIQQEYNVLVKLVKQSNQQRELKWANDLTATIKSHQAKVDQDEYRSNFEGRQMIDRARRAKRTMLADAISVVNKEYTKIKEKEIKDIKDAHDHALKAANAKIKQCRLDIIHKNDGISKLKGQIKKMQFIMRQNNLVTDNANSHNNTKTMIESLQQKLVQREESINSLIKQIMRIQSMSPKDRKRSSSFMGPSLGIVEDESEPIMAEESFDLNAFLPDVVGDLTRAATDNTEDGVAQSRKTSFAQIRKGSTLRSSFMGSFVRESNAGRRGSMLREKRASISLKGLASTKRPSIESDPLPEIEIKKTLEERVLEITEKYEKIISIEQSRHHAEISEIMEQINENDAFGSLEFKDDFKFSKKRLSENRTFQKASLELLDTVQQLFPTRIHPSKVSSYTQCELDDFI